MPYGKLEPNFGKYAAPIFSYPDDKGIRSLYIVDIHIPYYVMSHPRWPFWKILEWIFRTGQEMRTLPQCKEQRWVI